MHVPHLRRRPVHRRERSCATKDRFYPEFAQHLRGDAEAARVFKQFLDRPHRVSIEFTPDFKLSFDGTVMWQRSPQVIQNR